MNAPTSFDDLPAQAKDEFYKSAEKFGVGKSDVVKVINTADAPDGNYIASGDPQQSHAKMTTNVVEHLDHLKSLIGIPDSAFEKGLMGDRHVIYPQTIETNRMGRLSGIKDPCALDYELTKAEKRALSEAINAYVNGYSAKVDPRLAALANAARFPFTYSAGAAEELIVPNGTQHLFKEPRPQGWVYGVINVGPTGSLAFAVFTQIVCPGVATMQADIKPRVSLSVRLGDDPKPNIDILANTPTDPPYPGDQTAIGGPGIDAKAGTGTSDKNGHYTCNATSPSQPATDGSTPAPGLKAGKGADGVQANAVYMTVNTLKGLWWLRDASGSAANGGKGGKGGKGGTGGMGVGANQGCTDQAPGKGGKGSDGATGGMPGNGAQGVQVLIKYKQLDQTFVQKVDRPGGQPGQPGKGGEHGDAGDGGPLNNGRKPADPYVPSAWTLGPGSDGQLGNDGKSGTPGPPGAFNFSPLPPGT
ncbi:MAG: hypothetical protein WCE49_13845 [Terrimicrobiaceae bacterium]